MKEQTKTMPPNANTRSSTKKFLSLQFRRRSKSPEKLPHLSTLLQMGEFNSIHEILQDTKRNLSQWFDEEYSITGENCLHTIMKYNPPPTLIHLMIERLVDYGISEPELSVDDLGRTPLHHAVGYSCSPAVVHELVSSPAGRLSARAQDADGRLPLHMVLQPYGIQCIGKDYKVRLSDSNVDLSAIRRIMKGTISVLLEVCPQSVTVRDDKKRTALDYAERLGFDVNFRKCASIIIEALRVAEEYTLSTSMNGLVIEVGSHSSDTEDDVSVLSL